MVACWQRHFKRDAARALIAEHSGWSCDPFFAMDVAVLRHLWRVLTRAPLWLDTVPIAQAFPDWTLVLPRLGPLLERLGWTLNRDGPRLCWSDDDGAQRAFKVGFDGFKQVEALLRQHHRDLRVYEAGRVCRSFHRDGDGLATGLDLPPPAANRHFFFEGHRQLFGAGSRFVRYAASASAGQVWFLNKGANYAAEHPRRRCMCGGKDPSRPHLVWICEHTAEGRQNLALPTDRTQERLFARGADSWPRAPVALDFEDLVREFFDTLEGLQDSPVIYLATDGSSRQVVGAYSVVSFPREAAVATGNDDEDQESFKQELLALRLAAMGAQHLVCTLGWRGLVVLVCDCQAALGVVGAHTEDSFCELPLLAKEVRSRLASVDNVGHHLRRVWVPAHGRRPHWEAPSGLSTDLLRSLNDRADETARACMSRRLRGSARQAWWRTLESNSEWEQVAILAAAAAAHKLQLHFEAADSLVGEAAAGVNVV
ncbi:unnamed protein product [Symbiodinium sp. CCMP2592]|nr:unnamed protein product [Symbiodinium sp. CCMP2592]